MRPFTCAVCGDRTEDKCIRLDFNKICGTCFCYMFELAITDETHFPAHWGKKKLDHTLYENVLGEDLFQRYSAKKLEYTCPPMERIYCSHTDPPRRPEECQTFVGRFCARKDNCVRCDKCMWYTCLRCEETFSTSDTAGKQAAIEHECDSKKEEEIAKRVLQDLKLGKDYQICPSSTCRRVWSLWDGCNHMRCACGTYFCFICGTKTDKEYSHFKGDNSTCPLYGQPDDPKNLDIERVPLRDGDLEAAIAHLAQRRDLAMRYAGALLDQVDVLEAVRNGQRRPPPLQVLQPPRAARVPGAAHPDVPLGVNIVHPDVPLGANIGRLNPVWRERILPRELPAAVPLPDENFEEHVRRLYHEERRCVMM